MTLITKTIDFFYPLFKRFMPLQTFRYAACGGSNMTMGLAIYFVLVNWVFTYGDVQITFLTFKPHNAALFIASSATFFVGFLLNKFVVFTSSVLRGRIQLFRYFLSFFTNLIINYLLLKLLVEMIGLDAFLSQVITTAIIVTFSYFTQKHFSFKH